MHLLQEEEAEAEAEAGAEGRGIPLGCTYLLHALFGDYVFV
jgi:hypothetical protein